MKQIIIIISLFIASKTVSAQANQWITIKVPQIKCWECKERLDNYLKREKGPAGEGGIIRWNIYQTSGTLRIQFSPKLISSDYIKVAINNAGFDADDEKAEETAYNRLPPACKRAEDGGGPQKGKPCHMPPQ